MASRMKERYAAEIAPALNKKFGYKSVMQIPKLDKVIVNVRCGDSKNNAKDSYNPNSKIRWKNKKEYCNQNRTHDFNKKILLAFRCPGQS